MTYEFPADIRDRLQARLNDGTYSCEDDVIRDAMDALDEVEQTKHERRSERNRLAAQQSEQGLSRPLDDERVLARLLDALGKDGIIRIESAESPDAKGDV